ncbi:MAG: hypothetical protein IJW63_10490 [Lachnospiraceae bacterium]|nr:hypothetical protein [Lachnospiraceae bacterium]
MRKRIEILVLIISLLGTVTGCGKEALPNTYIPGSDYQYTMFSPTLSLEKIQHVEGGVYLVNGQYIYYLDESTDTITPLCNKVDCLHERETDEVKKKECNAYIVNKPINNHIQYYNGYIYYLDRGFPSVEASSIYRISEDGSKKEMVYQWSNNELFIDKWALHRGVVYYTSYVLKMAENTATGEQEMKQLYTISGLPVDGLTKKPITILNQEDDLVGYDVIGFGFPRAYGNYVYFYVWAYEETTDEITSENVYDYEYYKEYVYDVLNDECRIVEIENQKKTEVIQLGTFWKDKAIYYLYDFEKELLEPSNIYMADLDGTNVELFLEDIPQGYNVMTDGHYLYLSNDYKVSIGTIDEEKTYWIYNQDLELIDTYHLPYEIFGDRPMGTPECQYILIPDEEGLGFKVLRWDKENVGNYQGSNIEVTEIVYSIAE